MLSAIISIVSLIFLKELAEAEILAVEIGSTVLLPCESTNLSKFLKRLQKNGYTPSNFYWDFLDTTFWANRLKGRELLSTDDKLESYNPRFNVYFQYNLQIGISQVEDAGEYSCILKLDQSEQKINYKLEIVGMESGFTRK